jgi:hypothetical protein
MELASPANGCGCGWVGLQKAKNTPLIKVLCVLDNHSTCTVSVGTWEEGSSELPGSRHFLGSNKQIAKSVTELP